jgi:hypothetical protein
MREAIQSLRDKLSSQGKRGKETDASLAAVPPAVSAEQPKGVGTTGVWSVETRYPSATDSQPSESSEGSRLLSRANEAVEHAARGWPAVIVLCVLATLAITFALRRAHRTT